ncbi:TatD family hydrolase [Litchfieldia alkalitelluris]|uniref:TatD family hydrolase n=1 Tax=Litchfieldia alkalitelluris TaxID=304268 RepID=UPI000996E6EC|nr:TatD family hydrolase [Litchfieldia alkalitelluris]
MIDAHIHLDQYQDIDQQIQHWMNQGISHIVAVSTDLASSYKTLELKIRYPNYITAAIGFHPEQPLPIEHDILEWQQLLKKEQNLISAIGEVGLPYYTIEKQADRIEEYIDFLTRMVIVSKDRGLPLILHAVHEHAEIVLDLLKKNQITSAHFHWLKCKAPILKMIIDEGYFVSVTPEVVYRERDQTLLSQVPLSQLLLETDGPWSFNGPFKDRDTSPVFLNEMLPIIAEIKRETKETIILETSKNACKLFKI